jgi:predicted transcriptional regulator
VELLIGPEEYARLEEIARQRNESVAAVIRRAVAREYLGPTLADKRKAIQELFQMEVAVGTWDEVKRTLQQEVIGRFEAS